MAKEVAGLIKLQIKGGAAKCNLVAKSLDTINKRIDKTSTASNNAAKSTEKLNKKFDVKDDDATGRFDSLIREWTASQMEEYLTTGTYPHSATATTAKPSEDVEAPVRRTNYGF